MRIVRENILVAAGEVFGADTAQYIYSLDGESEALAAVNPGDLAFYDARTNVTVLPGVTADEVPHLGIAQAIGDGTGLAVSWRKVFGGYINSCAVENVTTEPGKCGCNGIQDFYFKCVFTDTPYTLTIQTRGDRELDYNLWNRWSEYTATVKVSSYACDTCDNGLDCKAISCELARQFNAQNKKRSSKGVGSFVKRALKQQAKNRGFTVYAIHEIEALYNITHSSSACEDCDQIDSIGGITINGTTTTFRNTTVAGDDTKSWAFQEARIIRLINKAFRDAKVEGHAAKKQQLSGTGAPCCDFQILINSCVDFDLLDGAGAPLTPAVGFCGDTAGKYNPFDCATTTKDASCLGCSDNTSKDYTCGIRVVADPMPITCDCTDPVDRKEWYHREVRFKVTNDRSGGYSPWNDYFIKEIQKPTIPDNLGVQWRKRILDMNNGGTGYNYDNWTNDNQGLYDTPRKGTAFTEAIQGLGCKDTVCSISIAHNINYHEKSVNGSRNAARGVTHILVPNGNDETYNVIKSYLDPWLASLNCGTFGPIECTVDVDQLEHVNFPQDADGDGVVDPGTGTGEGTGTGGFDRGGGDHID